MIAKTLLLGLAAAAVILDPPGRPGARSPPATGRPGGTIPAASASRRSPRSTAATCGTLKVAWTFHTGDAYQPKKSKPTAFEATPIYIDGTLYLSTPLGRILALDPVTGAAALGLSTPKIDKDAGYGDYASRGVSTWKAPSGQRRIYLATIDARLIAVDAATGKPCADFGDHGVVDLRRGLRIPVPADRYADYEETSPPAVDRRHDRGRLRHRRQQLWSARRAARCAASTRSPAS